jgi:hypothetical protein
MEGQDVVTSDEHRLGHVVAERDGYVVVESGHVFKSRYAIPTDFLHEHDGVLRATVAKSVVTESPKLEEDEVDLDALRLHYGLIEVHQVDPDPEEQIAETEGLRHGVKPAPAERLDVLEDRDRGGGPVGGHGADSSTFGGHPRTTEAPDPRRDWADEPERRRT